MDTASRDAAGRGAAVLGSVAAKGGHVSSLRMGTAEPVALVAGCGRNATRLDRWGGPGSVGWA